MEDLEEEVEDLEEEMEDLDLIIRRRMRKRSRSREYKVRERAGCRKGERVGGDNVRGTVDYEYVI